MTKNSYAISAILKVFSLFSFIFFVQHCAVLSIVCECLRIYLPTDLFLRKPRKYTYEKLDMNYCRQTASSIPSGVKAYIAQSNPLHLSYLWQKSNFHLTHGTYRLPGAYMQNFANNKSSLPVRILQNNTSESTINPLKIWRPLNKKVCPRK